MRITKTPRLDRPSSLPCLCLVFGLLLGAAGAVAQAEGVTDALEVQIALDVANFSPGAIDGLWGDNTRGALRAYQSAHGLDVTGELDAETRSSLKLDDRQLITEHTLTADDLAGPFIDQVPESPMDQAKLDHLAFTSPSEAVAERFHLTEERLEALNPGVELKTGATIRVPHLQPPSEGEATPPREPVGALHVVVSKGSSSVQVKDEEGHLVFYAPVTAGSEKEPLPLGEWKVEAISIDPQYHYDPKLITGADPSDREVSLPPGPNNPVGLVWIGIDKEHYGLHGTPEPSEIGYTESSGCVRLTNWDAETLAHLVTAGTRVTFQE